MVAVAEDPRSDLIVVKSDLGRRTAGRQPAGGGLRVAGHPCSLYLRAGYLDERHPTEVRQT